MVFPLDIRVGFVERVEDHPNADRLYVLSVDLGGEKRTLVAGLKAYYSKDDLAGKKVLVLCNLKHAKIRGVESQGMVLAADDGKVVALLRPEDSASVGERVDVEGEKTEIEREIDIDQFLNLDLRIVGGVATFEGKKMVVDGKEITTDKPVEDGAKIR